MKPGFRRTVAGTIPDDWEVVMLGDVATVRTGPFGSLLHERDYVEDGTPIITVEHLSEFGVVHSDLPMVSGADLRRLKTYILEEDDIVFSRVGSVDRNSLVSSAEAGWLFSGRLLRIRPQDARVFSPYLSYQFRHESAKRRIRSVAVGQTMPSLNTRILSEIDVVLPPLREQRAIAAALADIDALLTALDQLIAQKRHLRLAAIQQLLTGVRRLPGFGGEWRNRTLEEAAVCLDNLRVPLNEAQRADMKGDYPYCGANGVVDYINRFIVDDDIVLIAEDGGYFSDFATRPIAYCMEGKCWINNHAHILKAQEGYCQDFIFYSLVHKDIRRFLSSGTREKLNKSEMFKVEIRVPPTLEEQQAIASIFSDVDVDIASLEKGRDKTRLLKQGMMQELLTGRVRLV